MDGMGWEEREGGSRERRCMYENCECVSCSVMSDSATSWTLPRQAPLSMEFSRQEYWSGLLFHSSGDPPNPGIEPGSPVLQADSLWSESLVTQKILVQCIR